jgi:hypothetical protein
MRLEADVFGCQMFALDIEFSFLIIKIFIMKCSL